MEWIDVNERLPEKHGWYLVFDEYFDEIEVSYYDLEFSTGNIEGYTKVTHWMPLPEPPKKKGGAE
jgi:hypothetical protein